MFTIFGFYKFQRINNLKKNQIKLNNLLLDKNMNGSIIISKEGLNGSISGINKDIKTVIIVLLIIINLYQFSKRNEGGISYTIGGRNTKKELIYFSDRLRSKPGKHGYIEIKGKRRRRQNHKPRAQYVI